MTTLITQINLGRSALVSKEWKETGDPVSVAKKHYKKMGAGELAIEDTHVAIRGVDKVILFSAL